MFRLLALCALLLSLCVSAFAQVNSVPSLMNFQGKLAKPDGTPVPNGAYSIRFSLHSALTGGTERWNQTISNVAVRNGAFAVLLSNFPAGTFNGNLWLEIKVGTNAALTPRQPLATVPYAFKADSVKDRAITNDSIAFATITQDKFAANTFNSIAWQLGGNLGTDPAVLFVGTADNQPLNFRVNNRRIMRYEPGATFTYFETPYTLPNIIGGYSGNSVLAGVSGATISGGGGFNTNNQAAPNIVLDILGTIGGGAGNIAGTDDDSIYNSWFATVGGGMSNHAAGSHSVVGGGRENIADGNYTTIAGGRSNTASFQDSTIGGGTQNIVANFFATVPGGARNEARGAGSFAAGIYAKALHDGAFVWADNLETAFASVAPNTFSVRARGGLVFDAFNHLPIYTGVGTTEANRYVLLLNSPNFATASGLKAGGVLCADDFAYASPDKNSLIVKGAVAIGSSGSAGYKTYINGSLYCIGLTNASDARWKQNIASLPDALDAILRLRGVAFDWKPTEGMNFSNGRQIGFLAQEVERVLPELVTTDTNGYKSVAYANIVPVLVEAVKTLKAQKDRDLLRLQKENDGKERRITGLEAENAELKSALQDVLKRLEALESRSR